MITTARRKIERDLANLIKSITFWDIHIENYKIGIAENHNFNIYAAYKLIDVGTKGYFDQRNLHIFMSSNSVNCSHKECAQLMGQIFLQQNVDYSRFVDFILPQTNKQLKDFHIHREDTPYTIIQVQFAQDALKQLFERVITSIREINKVRQQLQDNTGFDIHSLWKIINERSLVQTGDITDEALLAFIKAQGSSLSKQEFQAIQRHILEDQDRNYITQLDFNRLLMPPEFIMTPNFTDQIKDRVKNKYAELGIEMPIIDNNYQNKAQPGGQLNFRRVFDPVKEGRPQFKIDSKYLEQLADYKNKYIAPSRNYDLQYRNNPKEIKDHDYFYKDYYLHLHQSDQDHLYFNRFGKQYVYS